MGNAVNHPDHYNQGSVECIEAIKSALGVDGFCSFCKGQVMKYIWRYEYKNGYEDLQKAEYYLAALMGEEWKKEVDKEKKSQAREKRWEKDDAINAICS